MSQVMQEPPVGYAGYSKMDSANNQKNLQVLNGASAKVLTIKDGKILDIDARELDGKPISDKIVAETLLFDMHGEFNDEVATMAAKNIPMDQHYIALGAAGNLPLNQDEKAKIHERNASPAFMDLLKQAVSQRKAVNNSFTPAWQVLHTKGDHRALGAAGNGNDVLYQTAYELVRRVNYLRFEARRSFYTPSFQLRNLCNIQSVPNFNYLGFAQPKLMRGQKHISDQAKPDPQTPTFTKYQVELFADSFRWQTTMRERVDSFVELGQSIQRQVVGIFEEMMNERIQTFLDGATIPSVAVRGGSWSAYATGGFHHSADAVAAFEDAEIDLETFEGPMNTVMNRACHRLFARNIQGINVESPRSTAATNERSGTLASVPMMTYYIDNHVRNYFMVAKRDHFLKLLDGVKLDFSYRDQMTAGNMEGKVRFEYNNIVPMLTSAAKKYIGYS